jgi:D-alanyl-D-alanine carboxypeptidase (penicillin-binding protein 5/6)
MSNYLIKNYPEYYDYFKELEFTWDRTGSSPITQPNTNTLLKKNKLVDGIKTGYLAVEKYSLASSINRNGRRLIAVGSGFKTKASRSYESNKLLNYGLSQFATIEIAKKGEKLTDLKVWLGKKETVSVYVNQDIYKTLLKSESLNKKKYLSVTINYMGPIKAPIKKDDILGKLKITYNDLSVDRYDLFAFENVKKLNIFSRLIKSVNFLIWGDV